MFLPKTKTLMCLGALLLPSLVGAQYQMVKEYMGQTFFDDWDFYDNCECLLHSLSLRITVSGLGFLPHLDVLCYF